jgi:triacylglycerol lipase
MTTPINMRSFPEQAYLFARLSELAYNEPADNKVQFKHLGFVSEFIDVNGSQAYLLTNADDAIVVCRGTQPTEFKDIAADLDARLVSSSTGIGKVHRGFKTSVNNIWSTLEPKLIKLSKKRSIWCAGHSLGAAMATLVAFKLQRNKELPNAQALFTYGSPRVGNAAYIRGISDTGVLHFRFVNNADIVARVPLWPFRHFGGMYYMDHWGNLRTVTYSQLIKDIARGFIKGIMCKEINFFTNHSISRYSNNLARWASNTQLTQDTI